jgi:hypothetical protein
MGQEVENSIKIINIVFTTSDIKEMFLRNHCKSPAEPHGYPTYSLDSNTLSKRQHVMRTVISTYLGAMRRVFDMDTATSGGQEERGLDGPGIESRWEAILSAPIPTGSGAHPASYTMGTEVKRPGHGVEHPLPSSITVKERVELHI